MNTSRRYVISRICSTLASQERTKLITMRQSVSAFSSQTSSNNACPPGLPVRFRHGAQPYRQSVLVCKLNLRGWMESAHTRGIISHCQRWWLKPSHWCFSLWTPQRQNGARCGNIPVPARSSSDPGYHSPTDRLATPTVID
jgi:hypothetical protein